MANATAILKNAEKQYVIAKGSVGLNDEALGFVITTVTLVQSCLRHQYGHRRHPCCAPARLHRYRAIIGTEWQAERQSQ